MISCHHRDVLRLRVVSKGVRLCVACGGDEIGRKEGRKKRAWRWNRTRTLPLRTSEYCCFVSCTKYTRTPFRLLANTFFTMDSKAMLDMIRQRLRNTEQEIDSLRTDTKRLDEKFVQIRSKPPPRPAVPRDRIESDIARLEHRRNTTSMSLAEEKKLLKEMDKIGAMRKQHDAVAKHNAALDAIRASKDTAFDRLRTLRSALSELQKAEAQLIVCERLGGQVQPHELIESTVSLDGNLDKIGALVGKGGAILRERQQEYGVSIDIDRKQNNIALMGTEEGVEKAKNWIANVFAAEEKSLGVDDQTLRLLILRKGERMKSLEANFGVRVNLNRDSMSLSVRGRVEAINQVEAAIKRWLADAVSVRVPAQLLPRLVGKGGATLKAFQEEHAVDVQVDRENEVFVLHAVDKAKLPEAQSALEKLVEENTEHEKVYELEPDMIPSLIGRGGEAIQKIQSESKTYINLDRKSKPRRRRRKGSEKAADEEDPPPSEGGQDRIIVKGTKAALVVADTLIQAFFERYNRENQTLKFDPNLASMIVGKKGEVVAAIQKEHNTNIDISRDTGTIRVRGEEENVKQALAALKAVLDSYKKVEIKGTTDELGALVGKSGAVVQQLTKDTGAQMKIDRAAGCVLVSGESEKVKAAVVRITAVLEKFRRENVVMEVNKEFIPSLIGKGGENIKKFREEAGVNIDLGARGTGTITLRGDEEKIKTAQEKLLEMADRYKKENVSVRIRPEAYSALIGKGGENIQKIQADTGTQIDVRRDQNLVFVRGTNEDAVQKAVAFVVEIAGENPDAISLEIDIDPDTNAAAVVVGKKGVQAMRLQSEFRVNLNIDRTSNKIVLRGLSVDVERAKVEIQNIIRENVRITKDLVIPESAISEIIGKKGANVQKLTSTTGAYIDLLRPGDEKHPDSKSKDHIVRIRGNTDAVAQAFVSIQAIVGVMENGEMVVAPHHMVMLAKQKSLKLARIQEKLHVEILLDSEAGTVQFQGGDTDSHNKAKSEVKALLQFFFPKEFSRVALKPEVFAATFPRGETGSKLAELAEDSNGASFELDRSQCVVFVTGDETQVDLAVVKLKALEEEYRRRVREVKIPLSAVQTVIGKGGKQIQKLERESKCKYDIVRGQAGATVRITGNPEALSTAASAVQAIVDQYNKENVEMTFDPDAAGIIIGSKGATIRRLQDESGARVNLTDKGSGVLTLQGKADAIEKAKSLIKTLLEENGFADDVETIDIEVHPQDIPSIIGRQGVTIREIESKSGARVKANSAEGRVSIRGRPIQVEMAQGAIKDILDELRTEREKHVEERRKEQEQDQGDRQANSGASNSTMVNEAPANDIGENDVVVSRPAWIVGMSDSDRLKAQTKDGKVMSKTAMKNKVKRERKKEAAQSSLEGVENLLGLSLGRDSDTRTPTSSRPRRFPKEGPPPGFTPGGHVNSPQIYGQQADKSGDALAALANLGFGAGGSSFSALDKKDAAPTPTSGVQYSGLGYNLRL